MWWRRACCSPSADYDDVRFQALTSDVFEVARRDLPRDFSLDELHPQVLVLLRLEGSREASAATS